MSSKSRADIAPPKARRRDGVLMSAIREATRAELADFGYPGVTYEGVARRARTSKHVLYRRYSSRAHLVLDALPSLRWPDEELAWTHSLRADLLMLFESAAKMLLAIGLDNYRNLIAEADADLFSILEAQVTSLSERTIYPALERARARGELGPHAIPDRAATSIAALLRNDMVFSRKAADADTIAEILDTVYLPLVRALSWQTAETPPTPTVCGTNAAGSAAR